MHKYLIIIFIITIQLFSSNAKGEACSVMKNERDKNEVVNIAGLTVISGEDLEQQMQKAGLVKNSISAIICFRKSVVPTPNDKQVLLLGYPFYIGSKDNGESKMVILEFTQKDGYRTRLLSGQLTGAEQDAIALVLSSY
ncbi:hypothetical protein ACRWQM_10560 [Shewanella sp. HL-SH5]|uniref:hypothetical protein n=1 Tax=Shewanella sp. HL-SH5 TaxID=3436241 RepID=UPI003EB726C2